MTIHVTKQSAIAAIITYYAFVLGVLGIIGLPEGTGVDDLEIILTLLLAPLFFVVMLSATVEWLGERISPFVMTCIALSPIVVCMYAIDKTMQTELTFVIAFGLAGLVQILVKSNEMSNRNN